MFKCIQRWCGFTFLINIFWRSNKIEKFEGLSSGELISDEELYEIEGGGAWASTGNIVKNMGMGAALGGFAGGPAGAITGFIKGYAEGPK